MSVQPVLLIGTLCIVREHFLPVIKLREILDRISQRVVHRLIRAHREHYVRTSPRHDRVHQRTGIDHFDVDLDTALRGKGIIHHGLQDRTLVTSGQNPYLDNFLAGAFRVDITYRIVINHKGCPKRFHLMQQLCSHICLLLLRLGIDTADYQIVDVEFGLTQVQCRRSQSRYIVLKCHKLQSDLLRLLAETLQLLRHCLGGGDAVRLLSAVCHHIVHEFEQSLGFEIHRLYDLGIASLDIVVPVLVRVRTRVYQHLSVNLVQSESGILQLLENGSDTAQCRLQSDGMDTLGQIDIVRCTVLIGKFQIIPVVAVGKRDLLELLERDLAVYVYTSAGHNAPRIILAPLHHDVVEPVLRHFELPLDPLSGTSPRLTAHIVQHGVHHTVRLGCRGRPVILGIKRRLGTVSGILSLDHSHIVPGCVRGRIRRTLCRIFLICVKFLYLRDLEPAQNHRLIGSLKSDRIRTLLQIKHVRISDISHVILEIRFLPSGCLDLAGSDLVALIVDRRCARVRPDPGERDVPRIFKRNFPVQVDNTLCRHTSGFRDQILHEKIVET